MKKLLSLLLVLLLSFGTALPVSAAQEGGSDAELERVTRSVKSALHLDTDGYTDFRGDYEAGELTPQWYLYWTGDAGSLSVTALSDGTVVSYTLNAAETVSRPSTGLPSFPQGNGEEAAAAAASFAAGLLRSGETLELEEPSGLDSLDSTAYRFSGNLLLNGLPSPLSYSITVRAADNVVTRFRRDVPENTFLGTIPSASAVASQTDAAKALRGTQSLRLEYILPEDDSTTAVLCYLPDSVHDFYVDAKTGKLVDLTEREQLMYGLGMGGAANDATTESGAAAETDKVLSEAEQAGIQQLEGVQSSQALDKALRAVPEYGLSKYALASARFSVGEAGEDGAAPVTCVLRYTRANGEDVLTRTFTVDARTGQIQSLWSYLPWKETDKAALTRDQALEKAKAFLETYFGDHCAHLELYETPDDAVVPLGDQAENVSAYTFRFARKENGYFFPEQDYTVTIDASDGSVCGLSFRYDEAVEFEDPQGVISEEAAMDAWMATYDVTLGYLLVPRELTGGDAVSQRLMQMGLGAYYYLELGYTLERAETCRGIDAKSGEVVTYAWQRQETGLTYSDVEDSWAQADIERLAGFGVGYEGGAFQPGKTLTQWELVCLLYSLNYYPLDPAEATEQERNSAYAAVYSMGALTRGDRDDGAAVTRGQLVQSLLDAAGYGPVARLEGIFTCAYPDRTSIPADQLGYAAIAQGLGLVSGAYNSGAYATRAQAAAMLCRLMER